MFDDRVYRGRKTAGDVGIEIECEGHLVAWNNENWRVQRDDSLRNGGLEWTFTKPAKIEKVGKLLGEWAEGTKGSLFAQSLRTSVHVHVNCQDFTYRQIYTILAAYWIMDSLLVRWCGGDREGNLFCLRVKDADYLCTCLVEGLKDGTFLQRANRGDLLRYSSLNIESLFKFGSLEFRALRGINDIEAIEEWARNVYSLVQVASRFPDPKAVVEHYYDVGPERFLNHFFSPKFVKVLQREEWEELLEEGIAFAVELAYSVEDWHEKIAAPVVAPDGEHPDLDDMLAEMDDDDDVEPAPVRPRRGVRPMEVPDAAAEQIRAFQAWGLLNPGVVNNG
jgi:hypothetical protein